MSTHHQPSSPHDGTDRERDSGSNGERYERPSVADIPAHDGPAVTAAGDSPPPLAAEWRH